MLNFADVSFQTGLGSLRPPPSALFENKYAKSSLKFVLMIPSSYYYPQMVLLLDTYCLPTGILEPGLCLWAPVLLDSIAHRLGNCNHVVHKGLPQGRIIHIQTRQFFNPNLKNNQINN